MNANLHTRPRQARGVQAGFMLIEVLLAILIFSFGVLAVVGLQANSARESAQAKYRADAMMLVNDLVGRMWASGKTSTVLSSAFKTDGTGVAYNAWLTSAQSVLPGIDTAQTAVTVTDVPSLVAGWPSTTRVTITLVWKAPNEPSGSPSHSITVDTQIS
jgi:type IV pilus assembly protein PilV